MSTIKDVAKLASVSLATVSNVLNGRTERMTPATLARVERAVTELGFRPSEAARQLKSGRTQLLGLLVPSMANPSFGILGREIEKAAWERHGHRLIVANTDRDVEQERAVLDELASRGVRGVIIASSRVERSDALVGRDLVAVSYDSHAPRNVRTAMDYVSVDNGLAATLAVEHLAAHRHRVIAFVRPVGETVSRSEKEHAFLAACARLDLQGVVIKGSTGSRYSDSELAELGQSLTQAVLIHPARPTGVLAVNDMMAFGLMAGLRDHGRRLPQDLSLVGMDALPLTAYTAPPLTSVGYPIADMARLMVDRIMVRIQQPGTSTQEFGFAPVLVQRGSVHPPPKRSRGATPRPGVQS